VPGASGGSDLYGEIASSASYSFRYVAQ